MITVPYDTTQGEVVWAVVPLRNESGSELPDMLLLSDHLVSAIEQARGLRALPISRTLATMQAMDLRSVRTGDEARALAQRMGADAIVVGSLTAWDPYTPSIGVSLTLFAPPGPVTRGVPSLDVRGLQGSSTDQGGPIAGTGPGAPASGATMPLAHSSLRLDAKNHDVLMELRTFASGRTREPSALGWRRYTASMDLYSQFAMFQGVRSIVQQEWMRVAQSQMPQIADRPEIDSTVRR